MHTEIIGYFATNPGAGGLGATASTGDSLIIKNNRGVSGPKIIDMWAMHGLAGFHQLTFPSGHDTTRGYRAGVIADDTYSLLPLGLAIPITAQEQETITIAGSAAGTEVGAQLIHYPDLPGVDQRVMTWTQASQKVDKLTTVVLTLTPTTAGQWSTGVAINAGGSDLLLANRDYCLFGITTTVDVCAVAISGPDTGNVRIGAPGANQNSDEAAQYFAQLARAQDEALIPVINSGNKASTLLSVLSNTVSATVATLMLGLLKR